MKRFGEVIKVKPEKFEEYKKLHNEIWPSILQIRVRNRSKQQENRSGGLRWKTFFIFYKKEGIRL